MTVKFPETTDAKYCEAWEAVLIAQLKGEDEMENPPNHTIYDRIHEELDEFNHKVIRLNKELGVPRCTCKTRNESHAVDCRIHPHRMVILLDTSKRELLVESLFLKPIAWDEELLAMILEDSEKLEETESPPIQEEPPLIEADPPEIISAGEVDDSEEDAVEERGEPLAEALEVAGDEDAELPGGLLPAAVADEIKEILQFLSKVDLSLIILKDGKLSVENPWSSANPEITFNVESGDWFYSGESMRVGSVISFKKDQRKGFASIIEANFEQLRLVMKTMEFYNNISLRKQLAEVKTIEII